MSMCVCLWKNETGSHGQTSLVRTRLTKRLSQTGVRASNLVSANLQEGVANQPHARIPANVKARGLGPRRGRRRRWRGGRAASQDRWRHRGRRVVEVPVGGCVLMRRMKVGSDRWWRWRRRAVRGCIRTGRVVWVMRVVLMRLRWQVLVRRVAMSPVAVVLWRVRMVGVRAARTKHLTPARPVGRGLAVRYTGDRGQSDPQEQ